MKNIWKWILGIVLVLAILAVPFALHYGLGYRLGFDHIRGPMMGGERVLGNPLPRGFDDWHHGPMMMGRGGFGLFGPFLFLGGLVKLAFFGTLLYGAYWLGRRNARMTLDPSTSSGQRPAPAKPVPAVEPDAAPKRGRKVAKDE